MKARVTVSLAFFLNGAFFACLACRLPDIQRRLNLDEAQLGMALLCCAIGAFVGVAAAGVICAHHGSHRIVIFAGFVCCVSLSLLSFAATPWVLALVFVCFGAATATMDVAMNINGVAVEKLRPKPIMSSLHGMFSLGGVTFAAVGWLVVRSGVSVQAHFVGAAIVFAAVLIGMRPRLLPAVMAEDQVAPAFAWPEKAVLVIGLIGFCAFLSEGAMGDWSAIYMRKVLHQTPAASTLGYLAFTLTMMVTRFSGDAILHRWGPSTTLRVCGLITAVGMGLALWFVVPWLTIVGFGSVGMGMATVAPIAFSVGGRIGGDRPDHAISSIATVSYVAFLVGPSLIGFIANAWSLREAMIVVVVLALAIVVLAGFVRQS
jgi:predicted MFS family arabinose efflux permease